MVSRKEPPKTGTSSVSAIIPSFYSTSSGQPVGGLRRSALRPGNVHSAEGWQELLEPVVKGYREKGLRLLFRGDAAFGKPELYEYLEQEKIGYAIRLSANAVLQREIAHLLVRPAEWPSRKPIVCYHDFTYQAQSWSVPRRVVAKVEWHQGELFPRLGFIVTNLSYPPKGIVRFYNSPLLQWPWHGGAMDKGGEVRRELDQAVVPQVHGQSGEAGAVHPGLQPGQLREKAGLAGGDEALVADQSSDQADQDRWAAGTTRSQTGVPAC